MLPRIRWTGLALAAFTSLAAIGLTAGVAEAKPKHWQGHHHAWRHPAPHYGWHRGNHYGWYKHHRARYYGYRHHHRYYRQRAWGW
jgi:hypothetical protein